MSDPVVASAGAPLQRGTPPGSLRYFSVLFAPPERRALLESLYAFEAELRDTVASASHDVAHTRLQWWRGEVDRYVGGRPQHPVTVALLGLRDCASHDPGLLHELLTGTDLDLARMTYATRSELEAYLFRAAGSLQTLAAAVLAGTRPLSDGEREFARRLGSAVRQCEALRDFAFDRSCGRLYLPMDEIERAGLDPTDLDAAAPQRLQGLLEDWRAQVRASFDGLLPLLTPEERSAQRPGLVLCALHQRLLERIDLRVPLRAGRTELPPWRRLWTAWTTAVRHA